MKRTALPQFLFLTLLFISLSGCGGVGRHNSPVDASASPQEPECRFLLTFDDGPAISSSSPTASILDRLMQNNVQAGIKAIFFVQTRSPRGGGSPEGLRLLQQEHAEKHVLALHSGSIRGHLNHTTMKPEELKQAVLDGIDDLVKITGSYPLFVRPTFWRYNARTLALYENNGLHMLLSDVKSYDGGSGAFHLNSLFSSQRHGNMLSELRRVRARIGREELPVVNGVVPIIVTFHDTNRHTAAHLEEYLQILVEEARRAGIRLSNKPFYDDAEDIRTAALHRAEHRIILETRLPARISRFFKRS